MASDWSKRVVGEIRQRQRAAQQNANNLTEQRLLREEQGPALWQELRNAVQILANEVNSDLPGTFVYNNLATDKFSVTRKGKAIGDNLRAEFAASSGMALFWKYEGRSQDTGSCSLAIDEDGRVYFKMKGEGVSPESLAQKMLDGLI